MRKTYITNIDLQQAKAEYMSKLEIDQHTEVIPVQESLGRVTAEPVFAQISSPHYNASAMDGIAVKYRQTAPAREVEPLTLFEGKDFIYVNTGNPVPAEFDAVIMIEEVIDLGGSKIQLIQGAAPWQHIRQIGEDMIVGDMVVTTNHKLRSIDLGAILSGGVKTIKVYKQIHVGVMPTGNEIVVGADDIKKGQIIDSNSTMLKALVEENGGIGQCYEPVSDDYEVLKAAISRAVAENDMVLINAGSSAGTKDFTVHVIDELGEVVVHGIAIKPGKPTILGIIDGKPVIGIPGYPVSAYFSFHHFVKPIIEAWSNITDNHVPKIQATLSKRIVSSFKHEEKVRVTLGKIGNRYIATPLNRGAGVTMSLVKADGFVTVAKDTEGIDATETVEVSLLKPIDEINDTLLSIGSHDLMMDIISDKMNLSSGHVGSLGGIMALRRGECHLAPIHLLNAEDGVYNVAFIKKYFKGRKMALVKGVKRSQGLMVRRGNPKDIKTIKDLTGDVRYVNRQKGAGTRILLDYLLNKNEMDSMSVNGYERELSTHLAVAIAVKEGTADAGLGVEAAARAMDLEFIPISYEDYDFVMYDDDLQEPRIRRFIDILTSDWFRNELDSIGGYGFSHTGRIDIVESL